MQLNSGAFGTPVALTEANAQYHNNGISFRALFAVSRISDAYEINRAYANNTPSMMMGGYVELGYNFYKLINAESNKNLTVFARQEFMNLNYKIPSNGILNGVNRKSYTVVGVTFRPISGVVIKADYVLRKTDDRNDDLIVTPFPQSTPYYTSNGFFNLGFGYSF